MSDTSKQNNLTIKHVSKMTKGVREQDVRETTSHSWKGCYSTGSKKVSFTARHLGKLKLACTGPKVISTSPKIFLMSRIDLQFFRNLNSPRNFTYPLGKLRIEFTGKIAKSTSTSLSDMIFFAHCSKKQILHIFHYFVVTFQLSWECIWLHF